MNIQNKSKKMINKAWLQVMGLMDKGFNRNFYVYVVIVLLILSGIGFSFWYTATQKLFESQKENATIIQQLQSDCDSTRFIDSRYYESRQDSMNRMIFKLLNDRK